MEQKSITTFTDLLAWKKGHEAVLAVYDHTKEFPQEERFGLTSQMRRCAVSITSNIAEGFGRWSPKEKLRFYFISQGSITELQNQLIIARDIKYMSTSDFQDLFDKTIEVHKLTTGLIKSTRERV